MPAADWNKFEADYREGNLVSPLLPHKSGERFYGNVDAWVYLSAGNHYAGTPGIERELIVVVHPRSGPPFVMPYVDFAQRYGWKNDPSQIRPWWIEE